MAPVVILALRMHIATAGSKFRIPPGEIPGDGLRRPAGGFRKGFPVARQEPSGDFQGKPNLSFGPVRIGFGRLSMKKIDPPDRVSPDGTIASAVPQNCINSQLPRPMALPHYSALLSARHAAHAPELRRLLASHWKGRTLEVLDVACGDGFYAAAFDSLLGPGSQIVAVDVSAAFLNVAARRLDSEAERRSRVEFVQANAESLPFPDGRFDLVWCAQSLISLPDVPAALKEMRRVVRPGGQVGILENDPLHEIQLSWPVDLELAVRAADRRRIAASTQKQPDSGRKLLELIVEAELTPTTRATLAVDRLAPLTPADARFVRLYLDTLDRRLAGQLPANVDDEFRSSASRMSQACESPSGSFWMTWNDTIVISTRD